MEWVGVQFGTTVEELTRVLTEMAQKMGWDPRRV